MIGADYSEELRFKAMIGICTICFMGVTVLMALWFLGLLH